MTIEDVFKAQEILTQHDCGTRYIPVDIRRLLEKIVLEGKGAIKRAS